MNTEPKVCCIMLANGRPEMVKRAIRCFQAQTYRPVKMLIYNSGEMPIPDLPAYVGEAHLVGPPKGITIGELRNRANRSPLAEDADVLIHWDSDDWSHPNRITEQVALLQASGKECVGYRDMLFWDEAMLRDCLLPHVPASFCEGRAWLYENLDPRRPIGTSLCYWRKTWQRRPFADLPKNAESTSEYCDWLREVDALGVSSFEAVASGEGRDRVQIPTTAIPRMIASIHGGNTTKYDPVGYVAAQSGTSWKRAEAWDDYCRKEMKL